MKINHGLPFKDVLPNKQCNVITPDLSEDHEVENQVTQSKKQSDEHPKEQSDEHLKEQSGIR